jgi:histidinol-phosphatase (PHP family)
MRLASYHVHSTFCDGTASPADMIEGALEAGLTDIGFSAHAAWVFSTEWHLDTRRYGEYRAEIERLREEYRGRIAVRYGFEADYIAGVTIPDRGFYGRFQPEYLIGSIHYVPTDRPKTAQAAWCVDASAEEVSRGLDACFGGDGKRAVRAYWGTLRDMVSSCDFDIVGHPDLFRKRNGVLRFFNENDAWYRRELRETVRAIARSGKIVEINTGAIARKAMDGLYPSDEMLALLCRAGVPVTINSDAHSPDALVCAYDRAKDAARRAGYDTLSFLDGSHWVQEPF